MRMKIGYEYLSAIIIGEGPKEFVVRPLCPRFFGNWEDAFYHLYKMCADLVISKVVRTIQ
ncbi:unnamed protein product [Paramecium octaurelia]|uniref:Uncharacterized protein n=1 Tax=Paramecium octaurelia TaxID=43137 RepID=A0A8S1X1U6_PAROT|nr:unnamed protein product [Paramecium octaurelia]